MSTATPPLVELVETPPEKARLRDLIRPVEAKDPKRSSDLFTYIDLSSVDAASKQISSPRAVLASEAPSRARQRVLANDVLVSTVRPNLNGVAIVPEALDDVIASTGFCVLRPDPEVLDSRYLYQWVRSDMFVAEMVRRSTGASYPAVSDPIVKGSEIPLPPLPEQRRIAAILDQADELRAKRRRALDLLLTAECSLFEHTFTGMAGNRMQLRDLVPKAERINYGVVQPGSEVPGGVPIVRVGDLRGGLVRRSRLKRISPTIESAYSRSRLKGNEILVSCVGSIGEVAMVGIDDIGSNIARAVARIPVADNVERRFLAAQLRSKRIQDYFVSELRTVSQPTLNIKQLSETEIFVPSWAKQSDFASRISEIEDLIQSQQGALAKLDELFASLQHRAFTGQL